MENRMYNIEVTHEELKMLRKALRSTSGSIRKLIDNCESDSLSEQTCIELLFKYHRLVDKLDDAIPVEK